MHESSSLGELRQLPGHLDADVHHLHLLHLAGVRLRLQLPPPQPEAQRGDGGEGDDRRHPLHLPLLQLHLLGLHPHGWTSNAIEHRKIEFGSCLPCSPSIIIYFGSMQRF